MTTSSHHSQTLAVRQALWTLQKEVLTSLKAEFDRELGYQAAPTEWFQALTSSEKYHWLRELTSLMADIDILTELEFITEQHAATARAEIEFLLFSQPIHGESSFQNQYHALLINASAVIPHHTQLRSHVQKLPHLKLKREQSQAERKSWHEEHRHQSRKKRN